MKTFKNLLLATVLIAFSISANATLKNDYRVKMMNTVHSFIDGVCNGKPAEFNKVINNDAVISMLRGDRIVSFTKSQQLKELRNLSGTTQNCQTSFKIQEERENFAIVKVEMAYENFKKVTHLTLNYKDGEWGISQVSTVFE